MPRSSRRTTPFLACLLAVTACTDDALLPTAAPVQRTSAITAPNADPGGVPTYSQERPGTFADMADSLLWKHIEHSGGIAAVGLRKPGRARGMYRGRLLMDRSELPQFSRAVTSHPGVDLVLADTLLPLVRVRLADFATFRKVRGLPMVDFVEPMRALGDIHPAAESVSGCGSDGEWTEPRLYTPEGDVYSLKHRAMGIEAAWRRAQGAGVTIGVIDTGVDGGQIQLLPQRWGGRFDVGASAGRTVTYRDAWNGGTEIYPTDNCQHGTQAVGVATAPRDGLGPVGVAYRSNLVATRLGDGVVAVSAGDAQLAIRNTLQAMEGAAGPKIVSMSWQSLNWYWQVSNEIEYWHALYPNHLLYFGAAGTTIADWKECSVMGLGAAAMIWNPYVGIPMFLVGGALCAATDNDNVVFPAQHPDVVAVTCLDFSTGTVSNNCHFGGKVEFAAYQRFPTVYGNLTWVDGLGGSSGATPTVAGQAALVWSRYPWMTGPQVLARMRWASRARDPKQGYGIVNTYMAVGGIHNAGVSADLVAGGGFNERAHYVLSPFTAGGDGPFTYQWSTGHTGATINVSLDPGDPRQIYGVTITDHSDGAVVYAEGIVDPPLGGCEDPAQVIC